MTAITEPFSAVSACPECGWCVHHPFRLAVHKPVIPTGDDPQARVMRMITAIQEGFSIITEIASPWDPDDAQVVRQCRCGTEWPQR